MQPLQNRLSCSGTMLALTEMIAAFYLIMFLSEEERNVDGSAKGSAVGN
jgi:hypothetical protein